MAAAALTRANAATTVTYSRACAQFASLVLADLQARAAALDLTAAARGARVGW